MDVFRRKPSGRIGWLVLPLALATGLSVSAQVTTDVSPAVKQVPAESSQASSSSIDQFFGEFGHSIPIEVPAFHGIEPKLALGYSSSARDGWLGTGWQLSGLSTIERASPGKGTPAWTVSDIFLLDGQELVPCPNASPSCSTGGTHATKIEGYSQIKFDPAAQTWTVKQKNGTTSTYSTAFMVGANRYRWMLTTVADTHGNAVTYTYSQDGANWLYPASIIYNGNAIAFNRQTRPDTITAAAGGAMTTIRYRLKSIDVRVGASRVRAYNVNYTTSTATQGSLVSGVQQFGTNAVIDASGTATNGTVTGAASLPQATVGYNMPGNVFESGTSPVVPLTDSNGWLDEKFYSTIKAADVNGDGKADVCARGQGFVCFLSNGSGFPTQIVGPAMTDANGWGVVQHYSTIRMGDVNGDGKADVCGRSTSAYYCWLSNGSGFPTQIVGPPLSDANGWADVKFYSTIQLADVNGDGKADVCARGQGFVCFLSNGSGFPTQIAGPAMTDANGWGVVQHYSTIQMGDVNGDGKADVCGRSTSAYYCWLSNGAGFPTQIVGPPLSDANGWTDAKFYSTIRLADMNGDGKTDVCARGQGFLCYLSNGSGFPTQIAGPAMTDANGWGVVQHYSTIRMGDVNGDGKADVCGRSTSAYYCWLSNGSGFPTQILGPPLSDANGWANETFYSTIQLGDINGDGKSDVCARGQGFVCYAYASGAVDIFTSSSNGLGSTTTIAYTPSSSWPIQSPCPAGSNCSPPVKHTVSSMTVTDGRGGTATTTYSYSGGLYDALDRRFLGFRYAKAISPCNTGETQCPYTETTFKQDYGSVSKPDRVDRRSGAGVLLTSTINEYTTNGATKPYTSNLTGQWQHVYSGGTTCPGANCKRTYTSMVYDVYGNVTRSNNYGNYDVSLDEFTSLITYKPNATSYIVGLPALQQTFNGLATIQRLAETQYVYDQPGAALPNWNVAPVKGDATQTLRWLNSNNSYVTKGATYDSWGNALTAKDEVGNTTSTAYDATYHVYPISTTNALAQTSTQTWDVVCGKPLVATGFNGVNDKSTTTYDALCRQTRVDTPLGGFEISSYVNFGSPTTQYIQTEIPSGDGVGNQWSRRYFDGLGRTWRTTAKGPSVYPITQDTSYHKRGQTASVSEGYYTGTPRNVAFTYDALDRPLRVTNLNGTSRSSSYGLWSVTVTDELARPRTSVFDAYGQLTTDIFTISAVNYQTSYRYDLLGNQTGITDAQGNVWTRVYDSLGRLTSDRDPDRGTWTYAYFANGNRQSQTDAKAQTTTYTYDVLGRKRTETVGTLAKTWTYDQARIGFFNVGHQTSDSVTGASTTMDYDLAGREVKRVKTIDSSVYTFQSGYDAGGRLKWTTYPDGDTVGTAAAPLTYDGAGRAKAVPGVVTSATYKAWGAPDVVTLGNGVVTTYGYDFNHQTQSISTVKGATTLQLLNYARDNGGKITSFSSPFAGEAWSYTYDGIDRLLTSTNVSNVADNQNFSYSPSGNVLTNSRLAGTYAYPASGATSVRPHAVTNAGGVVYSYDANGNMTAKGATAYTWDAANRMSGAAGAVFSYDANNERVKKVAGGVTSHYPQPDYRVRGGVTTKHIKLGGQVVAKREGGVTTWLHADHLGSAQLLTNASGVETQRMRHRPYGERFNASTAVEEETDFVGERRDAETGLVYQRSRYYDPILARYTAADASDPNQRGVGVNRYAYAGGDPVNNIDDGNASNPKTNENIPSGLAAFNRDLQYIGPYGQEGDAFYKFVRAIGGQRANYSAYLHDNKQYTGIINVVTAGQAMLDALITGITGFETTYGRNFTPPPHVPGYDSPDPSGPYGNSIWTRDPLASNVEGLGQNSGSFGLAASNLGSGFGYSPAGSLFSSSGFGYNDIGSLPSISSYSSLGSSDFFSSSYSSFGSSSLGISSGSLSSSSYLDLSSLGFSYASYDLYSYSSFDSYSYYNLGDYSYYDYSFYSDFGFSSYW